MTGKLLIGQAGGATAVINRSLVGILREVQDSGDFDAVWGVRYGAEGLLREEFTDLAGISRAKLDVIAQTPGAALGSSRYKLSDEEVERVVTTLQRRGIRHFLYIGGNDSADTVHRIARLAIARGYELSALAVPKTIDNDLPVTDHSPGYGSIARYIAVATMDSAKDTESMPSMYPVKLIEVMGRDAGWVVAASALGKREAQDAPHLLYVPEHPLPREKFLEDVERVHREFGRVVAVVAETVRDEHGEPLANIEISREVDAFGHPLLRGTADTMCRMVENELGLRARFDKPGSLQRMSMLCASSTDLRESEEVGRAAAKLAQDGLTDRMVTIVRASEEPYIGRTGSAPLEEIANRQQLLPPEYLRSDATDITEAFRRYALPLLGPEPLPLYSRLLEAARP